MVTLRHLVVTAAVIAAGALSRQPVEAAAQASTQDATQASTSVEDMRIARVELWLKAVLDHTPGATDASANLVASWSDENLRTLWIDLNALIRLMRNQNLGRFTFQAEGDPKPIDIRYSSSQIQRLRVLACAAAGTTGERSCQAIGALRELDPDLLELAVRTADARLDDADNFMLRRGALLHSDIAMLRPAVPRERPSGAWSPGAAGFTVSIADGRQTELRPTSGHWDTSRGLLAYVRPQGSERPAPGRDEMVRRWYVATAAWMQDSGEYDHKHLDRALDIFPADPDLRFLSGSLHETYASPPVQSVVQASVLPTGITLAVGPEGRELRQAETDFRRSLQARPAQPEAHLRLGHVLLRLNRHADAARELREAVASTYDPLLLYYASLFLGSAAEALQLYDEAKTSFERAAALNPVAQSPHLALSELARRRGDRGGALREIQQVFDLPASQFERYDPWWDYDKAQARAVGSLLTELRRPFLAGADR